MIFAPVDCAAHVLGGSLVDSRTNSLADAREFAASGTGEASVVLRNDLPASVAEAARPRIGEVVMARAEPATEH